MGKISSALKELTDAAEEERAKKLLEGYKSHGRERHCRLAPLLVLLVSTYS